MRATAVPVCWPISAASDFHGHDLYQIVGSKGLDPDSSVRKTGFCKLIVDRRTAKVIGCHVVGERAVEIVQVAAVAISAGMRMDELARVPLAFPTYSGNLAYGTRKLQLDVSWQATG